MLSGCVGADDIPDGTMGVSWSVSLDGMGASCATVGVVEVELFTTSPTLGEARQRFACDPGRAESDGYKAGNYTVVLSALNADGMTLANTVPMMYLVRSGLSIPVHRTFELRTPPTQLAVQWTTNNLPPNGAGNCPANSTVSVDLDGGATQQVGCAIGGVLFSNVAPGSHAVDARLEDPNGLVNSQATTTTVIAEQQTMLLLNFVFP